MCPFESDYLCMRLSGVFHDPVVLRLSGFLLLYLKLLIITLLSFYAIQSRVQIEATV